jgi:hypothetical protein
LADTTLQMIDATIVRAHHCAQFSLHIARRCPAKRHFGQAVRLKRLLVFSVPATYRPETALSLQDGQRSLSMSHYGQERAGLV